MSAAGTTSFKDSLDNLMDLRPFPAAASQLLTACDNDDVTAQDVAEIIKVDPAMSVKIMQIANSPLYGFSGAIRSVDHATVVLGLRAVKNAAISLAVGEVFDGGNAITAAARQHLWTHSLACGCIARTIANFTKMCQPDEAFLAGVVHDVGKLLMFDHEPERSASIFDGTRAPTLDLELEAFGIDHAQVGLRCGEKWDLPEEINDVICFHHTPSAADFTSELIDIVAAANRLTRIWNETSANDGSNGSAAANAVLQDAHVDLSLDELQQLEKQVAEDLSSALQAFSN